MSSKFEWDYNEAMNISETLKEMSQDIFCITPVCSSDVVSVGVDLAEEYFFDFSNMIKNYAQTINNTGQGIEKRTEYLYMIDTNIKTDINSNANCQYQSNNFFKKFFAPIFALPGPYYIEINIFATRKQSLHDADLIFIFN